MNGNHVRKSWPGSRKPWGLILCCLLVTAILAQDESAKPSTSEEKESPSRLSDEEIPLSDAIPKRPGLIIEWGDKLLGQGKIGRGYTLPTGAVWQPSLWAFGSVRTAIQTFDAGAETQTEWVNRLDLFSQLRLSGTERVVVGIRPLDHQGVFSGYRFSPHEDWVDGADMDIESFYFEGDFAEIFPRAGRHGGQPPQLGFVLGRQNTFIQEGMMINDTMDAVGLSRTNIPLKGTSNFRTALLFAWDELHRNDNKEDPSSRLIGLFTEMGLQKVMVNVDLAFVDADQAGNRGWFFGASMSNPSGRFQHATRLNASLSGGDIDLNVKDGILLFNELSWRPGATQDVAYLNLFWAIDEYTSAARGPATGGPLGRTGLLFASVGMGAYKAPLSNRAENAAGGAFGYQHFLNVRRHLVFELGTRSGTDGVEPASVALGARFQTAMGQHYTLQCDVFAAKPESQDEKFGGRLELAAKY